MKKEFLDSITDEQLEKETGLLVLSDGRNWNDDNAYFIQLCDKDRLFDDKKYICHYEILHMKCDDKKYGNHLKGKIYVEIHFENKKYSPYFKKTVEELIKNKPDLEGFYWRDYCPGLRLKENGFAITDTAKILSNLKKLKDLTIDILQQTYIDSVNNVDWNSSFTLKAGKNASVKRMISELHREEHEIEILHEKIKDKLIDKIKANPDILGNEYNIDAKNLFPENPVNNINYIDLAAKTKDGEIIFFEIKTTAEARLCIRQAFGQLMEYSFFPNVNRAKKLVVVGTGKKDKNIENYLSKLNEEFNINIDYIQVEI